MAGGRTGAAHPQPHGPAGDRREHCRRHERGRTGEGRGGGARGRLPRPPERHLRCQLHPPRATGPRRQFLGRSDRAPAGRRERAGLLLRRQPVLQRPYLGLVGAGQPGADRFPAFRDRGDRELCQGLDPVDRREPGARHGGGRRPLPRRVSVRPHHAERGADHRPARHRAGRKAFRIAGLRQRLRKRVAGRARQARLPPAGTDHRPCPGDPGGRDPGPGFLFVFAAARHRRAHRRRGDRGREAAR